MKHVFFIITVCSLFLFTQNGFAQDSQEQLEDYETRIFTCFEKMKNEKSDSIKNDLNLEIQDLFGKALQLKASFDYPFASLKQFIYNETSEDKLLRIFNWNVPYNDGRQKYGAILHYYIKKQKKYRIFSLNDNSDNIVNPEKRKLSENNWYGALYYKMLYKKYKREKYYTLFGWDGNSDYSTKKIIEVLHFDSRGKPVFGAPIFKMPRGKNNRIIFEYSKQSQMMLRYDENAKLIVFDLLVPPSPLYKGQFQFYGPEGTYDGFYFKKGKWIYKANVDVRNEKKKP